MSNYAISLKRTASLAAAMALLAALTLVSFSSFLAQRASAAQLQSRSLTLASSLPGTETTGLANSETNGSDTTHTVAFTLPVTDASMEAIAFHYCTTAIGTCTAPTDLDVSGAVLSVQTDDGGAFSSAFSIDAGNTDADFIGITNTGANVVAASDLVFSFTGLENPSTLGTFFVRVHTFTDDTNYEIITTTPDHDGTVASSITTGIAITSRVAETLGFSTTGDSGIDGATGIIAPTGACLALTGSGAITLGDEVEQTLDIAQAYDNYSAFRVYTNASAGVVVQYEGDTLRKSVTEDITEIGAGAVASNLANEQFGLAADLTNGTNGAVAVASSSGTADLTNVDQSAALDSGTGGEIDVAAAYEGGAGTITDAGSALFAFVADTPTTIASSTTYVDCKTVAIRYLANIAPLTEAGTYTTTIVYSAVPTY